MAINDISNSNIITILKLLGEKINTQRLHKNISEKELSLKAGVSHRTVQRFFSGYVIGTDKLVRILRSLGLLNELLPLLNDPLLSPMSLLNKKPVKKRLRASKKQSGKIGHTNKATKRNSEPALSDIKIADKDEIFKRYGRS